MAPKTYPENAVILNDAELRVFQILLEELPAQAEVFHGYKFFDGFKSREIDFLILWPGKGVLFIEVKGGLVQLDESGAWHNKGGVDAYKQVTEAMFEIKQMLQQDKVLHRNLRSTWLLVFPDTTVPSEVHTMTVPRNKIVDSSEMFQLKDRIISTLREVENATMNTDDLELISNHLREIRTETEIYQEQWQAIDDARKRMTAEQNAILDLIRLQKSYIISGPAGSGKTFMALEQARRHTRAGLSTALICYNEGLARFLQKTTNAWPVEDRPSFVGMFHSLLEEVWRVKIPKGADNEIWNLVAPQKAIENLQSRELPKFDAFVVDEAQDFNHKWWEVLSQGFKATADTRICAFGDENQNIYRQSLGNSFPDVYVPLSLNRNLRCSDPIIELANVLMDSEILGSGLSGSGVSFLQCPTEHAHKGGDEAIERLMNEGWEGNRIALLTTNRRHAIQRDLCPNPNDKAAYWNNFFDDDEAFYTNAYAFKGLEESVVVIAIDGWKPDARPRELLYTAITRAMDKVVIVGDIALIRAEFGDKFAEYLTERQDHPYDPSNEISAAEALAEE